MKLYIPLYTLAVASAATADDMSTCATKHPHIANAIGKFCQNKSIMIPSNYAKNGVTADGYKYAGVQITGNCKPAQWVPQEYCFSQFWNMCANADGNQWRDYGNKKCQQWHAFGGMHV